jgi:hypothetical protein
MREGTQSESDAISQLALQMTKEEAAILKEFTAKQAP